VNLPIVDKVQGESKRYRAAQVVRSAKRLLKQARSHGVGSLRWKCPQISFVTPKILLFPEKFVFNIQQKSSPLQMCFSPHALKSENLVTGLCWRDVATDCNTRCKRFYRDVLIPEVWLRLHRCRPWSLIRLWLRWLYLIEYSDSCLTPKFSLVGKKFHSTY